MIASILAVGGFIAFGLAILIFAHLRRSLDLYTSGIFFLVAGALRAWIIITPNPNARLLVFAFFALGVTLLMVRLVRSMKWNS